MEFLEEKNNKKRKEVFYKIVKKYQSKDHVTNPNRRDLKNFYSSKEAKVLYEAILCDSFKVERPDGYYDYLKKGNVEFVIYDDVNKIYKQKGGTLYKENLDRLFKYADEGNNEARTMLFVIYHYGVKAIDEKYNIEINEELAERYLNLALNEKYYNAQECNIYRYIDEKNYEKAEELVKEYRIKETNANYLLIANQAFNSKRNPTNLNRAAKYYLKANLTLDNLKKVVDIYNIPRNDSRLFDIAKDLHELGETRESRMYAKLLVKKFSEVKKAKKIIEKIYEENKDDEDVMFDMAYVLLHDKNDKKSMKRAIELYEILAEKGNAAAINNLANYYVESKKRDGKKIIEMYEKVYEIKKDPIVLSNIAQMYYFGDGIEKDLQKAYEYFLKSYKEGNKEAAFLLGTFYEFGDVVEQDYNKAVELYKEGIGNYNALFKIGEVLYINLKKYEEAERYLINFLKKVEEKEEQSENIKYYLIARYYIAHVHQFHLNKKESSEKEYIELIKYFEENKLINKEKEIYYNCFYNLGGYYYNLEDYNRAFGYYLKLEKLIGKKFEEKLKKDYILCCFRLGYIYHFRKNYRKALKYYSICEKYEDSGAIHNLGCMYHNGEGVKKNIKKGKELIEKAKKLKIKEAAKNK